MTTTRQQKLWDYLILSARVLLAITFLDYGIAKLTGDQFGISAAEMALPVKDLSLFKLSWYLFDQQPFKAFIGISQIIAALLLLYNRTALIGVIMSIPILLNILVIDITYIKVPGFYWRLPYYLLLDFLILWHYRDRMIPVLKYLTDGLTTRFKYRWWAYLLLPVAAAGLEILGTLPKLMFSLTFHTSETLKALGKLSEMLLDMVRK